MFIDRYVTQTEDISKILNCGMDVVYDEVYDGIKFKVGFIKHVDYPYIFVFNGMSGHCAGLSNITER